MPYFDGKRVSPEWFTVLTEARKEGVRFHLDSGQRNIFEQTRLYAAFLRGGTLAAKPSPWAPHIRVGRADHALDINALDGGADRFDAWATSKGYPLDNTVRGEAWHKEIRAGNAGLKAWAHKLEDHLDDPVIRKGSKNTRAITRLQRLLKSLNLTNDVNGKYTIWTRRAVRRFQRKHRLPVDGVVGPRTWKALRAATNKDGKK